MVNAPPSIGIPAAVLAHQGGWDEILLVVGPIALSLGLLVLAGPPAPVAAPTSRPPPSGERHRPDARAARISAHRA